MNPKPRVRIVALLALITVVLSVTERAFASDCVHGRNGAVHVSEAAQNLHPQHIDAEPNAESSGDRSDCRHDAASGCGVSASGIIAAGYTIGYAEKITLVAFPPSSSVDLITTHVAFHPPRA
jgi:hypothetical protein